MLLSKTITLQEVKASASKTVYFSAHTCWWTDDKEDLCTGPIPLDPFGSPLFEAPKDDFIFSAEKNESHYGVNGLDTFIACHAKNFTPEQGDIKPQFRQVKFFDDAVTMQFVEGWKCARSQPPTVAGAVHFMTASGQGIMDGGYAPENGNAPGYPRWQDKDGNHYHDVIYYSFK